MKYLFFILVIFICGCDPSTPTISSKVSTPPFGRWRGIDENNKERILTIWQSPDGKLHFQDDEVLYMGEIHP